MMKKFITLAVVLAMLLSLFVFPAGVSAETYDNHNLQPKLEVNVTPLTEEDFDAYIQADPDKYLAGSFPTLYESDYGDVLYDEEGMATFLGFPEGVYAYLVRGKVSNINPLHITYQIKKAGNRYTLVRFDSRSIVAFSLDFASGGDKTLFNYDLAEEQYSIVTEGNLQENEYIHAVKREEFGVGFISNTYSERWPYPSVSTLDRVAVAKTTEYTDNFEIAYIMFTNKPDFDLKMSFKMTIGDYDSSGDIILDTLHNYAVNDPENEYPIESITYFDNYSLNGEKTLYYQGGTGTPEYTVVFNDTVEAAEAKGLDDVKISEVTVKSGHEVVPPENPSDYEADNVLYKFAGWDRSYSSPTEDMVVTAIYNAVPKRTVKFVEEDGETQIGDIITVNTDEFITAEDLPEATKEADEDYFYEFAGWKTVIGDVESQNVVTFPYKIVSDTTFKATFTQKEKVTVIFENEDGTEYHSEFIASGTNVYMPENPTKVDPEGEVEYRFAGWSLKDDEEHTIVSFPLAPIMDVTFVPVFTEFELYTVIFENADGTVASEQRIADGLKVQKLDPVPKEPTETEAYEFLYWSVNGANATNLFPYTVTADTTFKPVYKVIPRHLVTFYDGDGNVFETQRVADGAKATAPLSVPTKTNTDKVRYTFKQWQSVINNNVTGDVAIYPVFTPEYINITNYKKADANLDGKVDARDGILYAKHIGESALFDEALIEYMDLNEDGEVTMADLEILVKYFITEDMSLIN